MTLHMVRWYALANSPTFESAQKTLVLIITKGNKALSLSGSFSLAVVALSVLCVCVHHGTLLQAPECVLVPKSEDNKNDNKETHP